MCCAPCALPEDSSLPSPTLTFTSELNYYKKPSFQAVPLTMHDRPLNMVSKVQELIAQNDQLTESLEEDKMVEHRLTGIAKQWLLFSKMKDRELKDAERKFRGLSIIKEAAKAQLYEEVLIKGKTAQLFQEASKQVDKLRQDLQESRSMNEHMRIKVQETEEFLQNTNKQVVKLREANIDSALELETVGLNVKNLREKQICIREELEGVRRERLEKKSLNGNLKDVNNTLLAQFKSSSLETIKLRKEHESVVKELKAAMTTNRNLHREVEKEREVILSMCTRVLIISLISS